MQGWGLSPQGWGSGLRFSIEVEIQVCKCRGLQVKVESMHVLLDTFTPSMRSNCKTGLVECRIKMLSPNYEFPLFLF